jgi:type I restriction enzyme S subunit
MFTSEQARHFFQTHHSTHSLAPQLVSRLMAVYIWFADAGLVERKFEAAIKAGSDPEYPQNLAEMLMAYRLHQAGFSLKRSPRKGGPDFIATKDNVTMQVEVITPQPLPEVVEYLNRPKVGVFTVPLQHFLMNWTKGIAAKVKQLLGDEKTKGWREKKLVDDELPFVIAVNGCLFATALDDGFFRPPLGSHPWAATGLYALSDPTIRFDGDTGKRLWSGFEYRKELTRENRGAIRLDTFLDPAYAPVSAVWAISLDDFDLLYDEPQVLPRPRYASAVLHNPNADVKLPIGHLPAYEEWTVMPNDEGYDVTKVKDLVPRTNDST